MQSQIVSSRKCRLVSSLRAFSANDLKRDNNRRASWLTHRYALSTPNNFQSCLSQDSITCTCLSPLLSSVLLELCSSGLPPNLVKRELAFEPLSLDFLTCWRHCLFGGLQCDGIKPWNTCETMLSFKSIMGALSHFLCWKIGRTERSLRQSFGYTTRRKCWTSYGGEVSQMFNGRFYWTSVAYWATSSRRSPSSFL